MRARAAAAAAAATVPRVQPVSQPVRAYAANHARSPQEPRQSVSHQQRRTNNSQPQRHTPQPTPQPAKPPKHKHFTSYRTGSVHSRSHPQQTKIQAAMASSSSTHRGGGSGSEGVGALLGSVIARLRSSFPHERGQALPLLFLLACAAWHFLCGRGSGPLSSSSAPAYPRASMGAHGSMGWDTPAASGSGSGRKKSPSGIDHTLRKMYGQAKVSE